MDFLLRPVPRIFYACRHDNNAGLVSEQHRGCSYSLFLKNLSFDMWSCYSCWGLKRDEERPCIRLDIHNSQLHTCKTFMRLLKRDFTNEIVSNKCFILHIALYFNHGKYCMIFWTESEPKLKDTFLKIWFLDLSPSFDDEKREKM